MKKDVERTELTIARILKVGVLMSAAIIFAGLLLYLITGQSGYENGVFPTSPLLIVNGILSLKPYAIMLTGLFILILTPVLRVGISVFIFIREKDYLYVIITMLVFSILVISFLLGKVE